MIKSVKEWIFIIKNNHNYFEILKLLIQRYILKPKRITFKGFIFEDFNKTLYTTIREIFLKQDYTSKTFNINTGDIVVDFGSHVGVFIAYAHKQKVKEIYGFEADKRNFIKLESFINKNNLNNVTVKNLALSSKVGKINLFSNIISTRNSILFSDNNSDVADKRLIDSIDINSALEHIPKIDFIKIDVEGAEYEVLENCTKETFEKIDKMVLEYHLFPKSRLVELIKIINTNFTSVIVTEPREDKYGYIFCKKY
jgi:FkbM family methyltransferase